MPHETSLIATIVIGLVVAFGLGFLANRLRLSPLVGYLLAGILVGPHTPGFVGDMHLAPQLAEIGVILLMFGVGLHFSLGDLLKVKHIAVPGALFQIGVATLMGWGAAAFWGWNAGAGLIFGLALSVASTVVLLRALEQADLFRTERGRIAIGWLIVEDLAMVLALVLLPPVAGMLDGGADGSAGLWDGALWWSLGITLGKVALFVMLMLVGGRRLVPWLLGRIARTGSRELFTMGVLAIALGIAYGSAELFSVSFALGAFFAGMVLAESDLSHSAAEQVLPLRDAFAVLFFVSVGMLFDPSILVRAPLAVLVVVGIIVVGKSAAAYCLVRVFRYSNVVALTVAVSLAQIGEFSFILAGLGVALGVLPADGRDLILAGALLSITLNPFLSTLSRRWQGRAARAATIAAANAAKSWDDAETYEDMAGHAVVVGNGRVGERVLKALTDQGTPCVTIDLQRRRADALRARGAKVVYGDATAEGVLERAGIAGATWLLIATPDGFAAAHIAARARELNPGLRIVARVHSDDAFDYLQRNGVDTAIMGEREVARCMIEFARPAA
jgi:monovalent cation:H+ antiporter-2, CPA2 family